MAEEFCCGEEHLDEVDEDIEEDDENESESESSLLPLVNCFVVVDVVKSE